MTSPGTTLVDRLRRENLDQYITLVRMHLSFVVDINTDDVDCSTDKPKQFRWNFHKKTKNVNSSQNNTSNVKNNIEAYSITEEGILRLNELIDFLSKPENVTQEGIFRRTGSLSRQQELRQLLLTGSTLDLDEGRFSVHDCASVLKGFLADLPQPLLMDQYYQIYCTLSAQYPPNVETSESKLLTALQLLLLLLTPLHRSFLERLLKLLHLVADNEGSNRMSPDTLATMFTPHLLCPRKLAPEVFHADAVALSPLVSFMIRACESVLRPPAPLTTDAAAYFRRRITQRVDLDESQTDRTAARTVYTFVDRGLSGAGAAGGGGAAGGAGGALTDTALAQLYAHIHALPDSAHRRRLIKHFNRHNGYGTPLQIQRTGKVAGSRSFGDSIKRHIFNKGILNKTPKKGSGSAINTIEEKSTKGKHLIANDKVDVSHKNIVLKNLANKIASAESLDDNDYESDASNESTLSEGAVNKSRKNSPKFASEPNLNTLEPNDETPKNTKRRLFRSKVVSRNMSKKYHKRGNFIRGTPTCVSCVDDPDSDSDLSYGEEEMELITPKEIDLKHYVTSTPGMTEAFDGECSTPYSVNFRRASMSPITKSTQKLPKAMQESIMTPRSRKPLIMSERERERDRDVISESQNKEMSPKSEHIYCSVSPKNDSDFVSSDDEDHITSSLSGDRLHTSKASVETTQSISEKNPNCSKPTRFMLSHERPNIQEDLNITLCGTEDGILLPKCKENERIDCKRTSLTGPFRDYLLSRSVLTATPVDLSILNKSTDEEKITDSLMYCLDGNVPSDLTSSISNLAVNVTENARTPLTVISPNRKRCMEQSDSMDSKKLIVDKENYEESYEIRETDL